MSEDKARKRAFLLLDDIISHEKYANLTLKNALDGFDERDRSFICTLVYGTLDQMIFLDYVIALYARGRIQPKVKNLLRFGAFQILCLDRVPDSAAVNTTVALAESIGKGMLKNYINGVLRSVAREKERLPMPKDKTAYLSVKYAYPEFLVKELLALLGDETEAFLSYQGEHLTPLRVDTNKADPEKIRESLGAEKSRYFPECLTLSGEPKLLENGVCSVQSEASVAAVKALDPQKGDLVLDACAAPGGKTVCIASIMREGRIMALDKHEHRVKLIEANARRCGYDPMIDAQCFDMTAGHPEKRFDRVLVDAPCSGLGVLGQKPEIKNTVTPERLKEIEHTQAQILDQAAFCVKDGGVLVYSTCTVRPQENIDRVHAFLTGHPEFSLERLPDSLAVLTDDLTKGFLQLYPFREKTDGFFIARMRKK